MYEKLWNRLNQNIKKSSCPAVFLLILTVGWGVAGAMIGALIPLGVQKELMVKLMIILCTGGYSALIPGFFGGIFYLYRLNLRRSSKQSEEKVVKSPCYVENKTAV